MVVGGAAMGSECFSDHHRFDDVKCRRRAESWASVRDEVEATLRAVVDQAGSPVNIGDQVFGLTRNIIYRAAFGSTSREGQDEFVAKLQEFSNLFVAFNMADFVPWMGWIYPQGLEKKLEKARKTLDRFIDYIIDDHVAKQKVGHGDQEELTDMVDDLWPIWMMEELDVMFGGTETVASVIEWAMAELMKCPGEKKGYFIPSGTRVSVNAWAIGRDKTAWEDPETFRPDRFAKQGSADFKGNHFELIPFGSRRRSCPGMQLGLYTVELTVARLLHCFKWALPDGMKPYELDMRGEFGLTLPRAVRLVAIPTPRLHCPLF
ncbi:hypothetical protein MRB53_024836 [Persea americana]|uniref:Uncharacterized protein n=1 Tax=Persea americana TaxID=3435 RepID=A0ACC2LEJ9_PERAE|nr:hypothetical protein MRB53_024836 [Persea americana]